MKNVEYCCKKNFQKGAAPISGCSGCEQTVRKNSKELDAIRPNLEKHWPSMRDTNYE